MASSAVKVYLRARPTAGAEESFRVGEDNRTVSVQLRRPERERGFDKTKPVNEFAPNNSADAIRFEFDTILHDASQESVFTQCASEVCENVLGGYNGTVFAYGQTGAGKTFTMSGDTGSDFKHRGVIPRAVHHLFREVDLRVGNEIQISVSYLEIYNERLFDLLASEVVPDSDLQVVDRDGEMEVKHLTKKTCANEAEALGFFFAGDKNRAVSDHVLNKTSSRSHVVFTVYLSSRSVGDGVDRTIVSKLNLVDLAGSERVKKTNVTGEQLKEATFINKSLTFLEQIVNALSRGDKHVAFRQSKLTSVLRDALGGNCKTTMIACTWPDEAHAEETVSTCRFASRVMTLKTKAVVNESKDPRVLALKYERRCLELTNELAARDTFAGRPAVNYSGEMGEVEKRELEDLVRNFLETENANPQDLPVESLAQARATFRVFKNAWLEVRGETARLVAEAREKTASAEADTIAGIDKEGGEGETETGDVEAEGDTRVAAGEGETGAVAEVGDEEPSEESHGFAAGVAPSDSVPPPESPTRATNDVVMSRAAATAQKALHERDESTRRSVAFGEYKKSVAPDLAAKASAATAALRSAKLAMKQKVDTINLLKTEIDAVGVAVEETKAKAGGLGGTGANTVKSLGAATDGSFDVMDPEEYANLVALKKSKAAYRAAYEELQMLKGSLNSLTLSAQTSKQSLLQEFTEWYDKGGGLDLFVTQQAEGDDLDYGETFDQLELQRALNRDPESGAFFAAKKSQLGSTKQKVPVQRTVQHMRALGSTYRKAF